MKSLLRLALVAGIAVSSVDVAGATTATGTMAVSMDVVAFCSVVNVKSLNFGAQTTTWTSNVDAATTFDVNCTKGAPYTVSLGQGANYLGGARRMKNGTSFISYGLFKDSGRTTAWGDADTDTRTGAGVNQTFSVYGRVAANATAVDIGNYSDTVTITIEY